MRFFTFILSTVLCGHMAFALPAHEQRADTAVDILAASLNMLDPQIKMQLLETLVSVESDREVHQVSLYQTEVGPTRLLISGPLGFTQTGKKYPLLFIAAGFLSGKESIHLIQDPQDKILVGYEYPATRSQIEKDPSVFAKSIKIVPGQIALSLEWLLAQNFTNAEKLHVMGVSLGSLFLPVSLHLAQKRQVVPTSTILCFGGADLGLVIDHIMDKSIPPLLRDLTKNLIETLTAVHDPKLHLPYLKGVFLTIFATEDSIFPRSTSLLQYELLPSPKEIHWVQGPHIDTNQPEVIHQTLILVKEFLQKFE